MKLLVAGTGSIGQRHVAVLQQLQPDCRLVLLRADGRRDQLAQHWQAAVVATWAEALQQQPTALLIANPSALHAELLLQGLAAGLPLYIEKPVVTTTSALQSVSAAWGRRADPLVTQVGCNLRFLPSLLRLRELLHSGVIGRVVRASFEAGQWLPDWRPQQDHRRSYSADPARGGGVLLDLIHEIDAARWLLGELTPIACQTAAAPVLEIGTEAAAIALLRSAGGALVQLGLDYVARRPLRRYQLVGVRGTLIWDLPRQQLLLDTPAGCSAIDCGANGFVVAETYRAAMAEFLAALREAGTTSQPLDEGLRSAALAIRLKELACQTP